MSIEEDFTADVLCDVLKDYALAGAKEFKKLPADMREKLEQRLRHRLMLKDWDIGNAMRNLANTPMTQFLAAPVDKNNGFRFAFFHPRLKKLDASRYSLSLVVLFWVEKTDKIFAVRLEPSGGAKDAHGYAHMQFTRKIKFKDGEEPLFCTDQEPWLPDSYPAFALAYEHPIHFFAGLAMSIHGYCVDDATNFATRALTRALEANRLRKVLAEMRRFFGRDWPAEATAEV